ncbi:MAG TPA: phenylalanine--tRNA ligase subunit alpha, partial [Candidatus Cloacimonas acidaminovorans]|nr:phenylalanine--tRNA ligase subunit alpha [Candidatus Cloacimonas acidaminovorans]
MEEELRKLVEYAEKDIFACSSPNDLLNVKAKYLGKKSLLSSLYAQMRNIPVEERPAFGNLINEAKKRIEDLLEQQNKVIKENAWKKNEAKVGTDLTMPGIFSSRGGLHPLTIIRREIDEVFLG